MSERQFPVVAVLAFVAGLVVGSGVTLLSTRNSSSGANPAIGTANAAVTTDGNQSGGAGAVMNAADAKGTAVFVN